MPRHVYVRKWNLSPEIEAILRRDYKRIPTVDVMAACGIPLSPAVAGSAPLIGALQGAA